MILNQSPESRPSSGAGAATAWPASMRANGMLVDLHLVAARLVEADRRFHQRFDLLHLLRACAACRIPCPRRPRVSPSTTTATDRRLTSPPSIVARARRSWRFRSWWSLRCGRCWTSSGCRSGSPAGRRAARSARRRRCCPCRWCRWRSVRWSASSARPCCRDRRSSLVSSECGCSSCRRRPGRGHGRGRRRSPRSIRCAGANALRNRWRLSSWLPATASAPGLFVAAGQKIAAVVDDGDASRNRDRRRRRPPDAGSPAPGRGPARRASCSIDRGARALRVAREDLAFGNDEMHARLVDAVDGLDGAGEFAFQRAQLIDVLDEGGGAEGVRLVENLVADAGGGQVVSDASSMRSLVTWSAGTRIVPPSPLASYLTLMASSLAVTAAASRGSRPA